jgi:hypothetical protein
LSFHYGGRFGKARATNAHDDIVRLGDLWVSHFLDLGALAVGMEADGFHGGYFF